MTARWLLLLIPFLLAGCIDFDWGIKPEPSPGPGPEPGPEPGPSVAGDYQCASIVDADGQRPCDGSATMLELHADGSYRWGMFYDGTYELRDGQVHFKDPADGGTEASRRNHGGPSSWGPAEVLEDALVFTGDDQEVTWVLLEDAPGVDVSGRYTCMRDDEGRRCENSSILELTAGGRWSYRTDTGDYHAGPEEVRFTSSFGAGPTQWGPATLEYEDILHFGQEGLIWERIDEERMQYLVGTWHCSDTYADLADPCEWGPMHLEADGRWNIGQYEGDWALVTQDEVSFRGIAGGPAYWGDAYWDGEDVVWFTGEGTQWYWMRG